MSLTSSLGTPAILYRKLQREAFRAIQANRPIHKADHFFNFCITAHSMRDYCLEYLCKTEYADQKSYHELWNKENVLVATKEIANFSKHFILRSRRTKIPTTPSTKSVRVGKGNYFNVYQEADGGLSFSKITKPEVRVELSDGKIIPLYKFTDDVLDYWKSYLLSIGIKTRRVSLREYQDI